MSQCLLTINIQRLLCTVIKFHVVKEAVLYFLQDFNLNFVIYPHCISIVASPHLFSILIINDVSYHSEKPHKVITRNTVKPLLSGPPIKRTPSIKRILCRVPNLMSYISLYNEPLFSGHLYQADADPRVNCILN